MEQLLKSLLEDISTGGAGGATFTPGQGEQIATPFAFGSKKKPKKLTVRKDLFEAGVEVSYTPEKREEIYQNYLKDISTSQDKTQRYINAFQNYAIGDIIDNLEKAEQFSKLGEKMYDEFGKASDLLEEVAEQIYDEEGDKEERDKFRNLSASYWSIQRAVDIVYETMKDLVNIFTKLRENNELKKLTIPIK